MAPLHGFKAALFCALLAGSASSMAQREADALAPVVQCFGGGKFAAKEVNRLPEAVKARSVETLTGPKSVSMVDGYRVILTTAQGKPFVNLKIEQSAAAQAASDREAVVAQMEAFSSKRTPDQQPLARSVHGDVEVLALHQPSLDGRGPLSFYSMFVPVKSMIATMYVLNQDGSDRAFSTFAQYEQLRDEAAGLVLRCLAGSGA
ncbi:hypothetical protein [Ideonella paludis]|uniref:Uncharacterized protein n=1 Tax=Ideonella paludis TaxID=1233411 RepID=A0ABS5DXU7_9BURK|nr:hypothetical protein [Ideonella paludis]MBQ0935972.1 hypothetical protein [Ideonella paludis]